MGNFLYLNRKQWHRYTGGFNKTKQRMAVYLESSGPGPNRWCVGVVSPRPKDKMDDAHKERWDKIKQMLDSEHGPGKAAGHWPKWDWLDAKARDWNSLVADLHQENEADKPGEITRYIVSEFVDIAVAAIPIIDKCDD